MQCISLVNFMFVYFFLMYGIYFNKTVFELFKTLQLFSNSLWKTYGVNIKISTASITTEKGCEQLIKESLQLGRVDAIFNLAVVLADGLFENQTPENFAASFGPKARATEYLDEFSRELCPDLR